MRYLELSLLTVMTASGVNAAAAFRCDVRVPAPAYLRPNGVTELLADIVVGCDGDTPAGGIVGDIDLYFNTQTLGFGTTGPPLILSGDGQGGCKMGENVFAAERI